MLRVVKDRVVSIDYTIRLAGGELVESSRGGQPLTYLHGRSQIVPGVERAIEGREVGAELEVEVAPAEGYGDRDPEGIFLVPRSAFPDDEPLALGMTFSAQRPDGAAILFSVLRIEDDRILVDTNHPLAGQELRVWVAVRAVREATVGELFEGSARSDLHEAPLPS